MAHRKTTRLAIRRARARRESDGAVMFIVVVTLGLLAVMGVYGLTSTSADLRSAGHTREALQGQKAGEHALTMTAEAFNPAAAKVLVEAMAGAKRTTNCKSAMGADVGQTADVAPYTGALPAPAPVQCIRLSEPEMKIISQGINPWVSGVSGFGNDSFGQVVARPITQVEVSNPIDIPPPPGSGYDPATQRFTQVTVTVYVDVRKTPTEAAETVIAGRGRMTVGPITGSAPVFN